MSKTKTLNIKASGIIALAVMLSRVLGLIREIAFNALFGTSSMGIFLIAFRAPNLLRDLFAEGALSISFITIFSKTLETQGDQSAWRLASKMLTLTVIFMSLLSLAGIIFAKPIINILAPGFSSTDAAATVYLTQIMFPFILLVSLAALVMGLLNSKNVFGVPALASSFFNIGSIIGGLGCGYLMDPHFGPQALTGLALGTLLGGLMQLSMQLPSLRRLGFHFRPDFQWRDQGVRDILILTLPAIIAASTVQINVLINSSFASYVGKEAVTWLNSAFRLMQLPIGVFGVAIATITLPVISRLAVSEQHRFGPTLAKALRFAIFLTLPAAVGLWYFALPIISLIYEHGRFLSIDSQQTAFALQFYALGLVAYSCMKVLSPGFYAINRKWIPMLVSFVAIFLNILLNYIFIFRWNLGHKGLALSTAISASSNFLVLYSLMDKVHNLETSRFLNHILRCLLASAALAGVCMLTLNYAEPWLSHAHFVMRIVSLLSVITLAIAVYLGACIFLRVEETKDLINFLLRKYQKALPETLGS